MKTVLKAAAIGVALVLFCLPKLKAETLPYNIQAALIVKILEQDNHVARATGPGTVTIGIAYDSAARKGIDGIVSEILKLKEKGIKIKDNTIDLCKVSLSDEGELKSAIRSKNITALYIVTGSETDIAAVTRLSQDLKVLSITGDNSVERVKKGVTVGFDVDGGKPSILINTKSSVKEGREFSLQFLSLVKVCQ